MATRRGRPTRPRACLPLNVTAGAEQRVLSDTQIVEIAKAMFERSVGVGTSTMAAGLTYVGQFISHDILPNTTRNHSSRIVSTALNLDSVYGSDPLYRYELDPGKTDFLDNSGQFLLQERFGVTDFQRQLRLWPDRPDSFTARIPEQRNDENIIVSQVHQVIQRLHNLIVTRYTSNALEARRLTTIAFHICVIEDFIRAISPELVYQYYEKRNWSRLLQLQDIPDWFRLATFRFGHSTVRNDYVLSSKSHANDSRDLRSLFKRGERLLQTDQIEWKMLFSDKEYKALRFDTKLARGMRSAPFGASNTNIAEHNLRTAIRHNLAPGIGLISILQSESKTDLKEAIEEMEIVELTSIEPATFGNVERLSMSSLPMWLYILLEAQTRSLGERLGPLGGFANIEVLLWSMNQSRLSAIGADGYRFDDAVEKLGKFGEDLLSKSTAPNEDPDKNPKLSFLSLFQYVEDFA